METATILRLRPDNGTWAAAAASATRMRAHLAEMESKRTALAARRGDVLVNGSAEDIASLEDAIAHLDSDTEQALTMLGVVEAELPKLRLEERHAELLARSERLRREAAEVSEWVLGEYPGHAQAIMLWMEREAALETEAVRLAKQVIQLRGDHGQDFGRDIQLVAPGYVTAANSGRLHQQVRLPYVAVDVTDVQQGRRYGRKLVDGGSLHGEASAAPSGKKPADV